MKSNVGGSQIDRLIIENTDEVTGSIDRSDLGSLKDDIEALLTEEVREARIDELQESFREFSKDVPFGERLAYYDKRFAQLKSTPSQKGNSRLNGDSN